MGDKFDEIDNILIGHLCELMFGTYAPTSGQKAMAEAYYVMHIKDNTHMIIERMILEETKD